MPYTRPSGTLASPSSFKYSLVSRGITDTGCVSQGYSTKQPHAGGEDGIHEEVKRKTTTNSPAQFIRPTLRCSGHRRASSMRNNVKRVHFDSKLEDSRDFFMNDCPSTVGSRSSFTDNSDDDEEYINKASKICSRQTECFLPCSQDMQEVDVAPDHNAYVSSPVQLQHIWLSTDKRYLRGSVLVSNLSFQKSVVCRFTVDNWHTISEVPAIYHCQVGNKDQFDFGIQIATTKNLNPKTLILCIRYQVNGMEFWENNNALNYQVGLQRKSDPKHGERATHNLLSTSEKERRGEKKLPLSIPPSHLDSSMTQIQSSVGILKTPPVTLRSQPLEGNASDHQNPPNFDRLHKKSYRNFTENHPIISANSQRGPTLGLRYYSNTYLRKASEASQAKLQ